MNIIHLKKVESDKNKENELNIELNDLKSQIQEINDEIKNLKIISNIHFIVQVKIGNY